MKFSIINTITSLTNSEIIIARILASRGIGKDAYELFLKPPSVKDLEIADIGVDRKEYVHASKRLLEAYKKSESVVIYADYDVDGVTSASILWRFFHLLGFSVMPYTPNRKKEGYGFSQTGIDYVLKKYNPTLIIAVDHGVSEEKYIEYLKKNNVDTIVLDHHIQTAGSPKSVDALIYTKQVSAAGISYFFVKSLYKEFEKIIQLTGEKLIKIKQEIDIDYLALAGIASLTDVMPQHGMARALAHHGLRALHKTSLVGLRYLLREAGIETKTTFSSYDAGFIIGPRLNAVGRVSDALQAVRLLCTNSPQSAMRLAKTVEMANKERQKMFDIQMKLALEQLGDSSERIGFITSPHFEEGIVGLIASKLMEKLYIPMLVGVDNGPEIKGSARSIQGIDITEILKRNNKFLLSYGGHEKAAGFTLLKEHVEDLKAALVARMDGFDDELFERLIRVDMEMPLSNISVQLGTALEMLEPFGEQNREPLFMSRDVSIIHQKKVGKTGKHVQLFLKDTATSKTYKAIFFNGDEKLESIHDFTSVSVVYTIGIDRWAEEKCVLKIVHIQ
ncbi:MAG: DHHA1 domain-containing protein [Candidatus Roizmanbacteria bacterium]|nr:DHHA1 domain-containing protein [Candidatus Roizmanbacteria bacterium]